MSGRMRLTQQEADPIGGISAAPNLRSRACWSVLAGMLDDFVFEDVEWSYDRRGRDQETPGGANDS